MRGGRGGGGLGLHGEGSSKKTWDPRGESTLSLEGVKGGRVKPSFCTVVCANLFRYQTDVIFSSSFSMYLLVFFSVLAL